MPISALLAHSKCLHNFSILISEKFIVRNPKRVIQAQKILSRNLTEYLEPGMNIKDEGRNHGPQQNLYKLTWTSS